MRRLRILLLPCMVALELAIMLLVLLTAIVNIDHAERLLGWAKTLPDLTWFYGKNKS